MQGSPTPGVSERGKGGWAWLVPGEGVPLLSSSSYSLSWSLSSSTPSTLPSSSLKKVDGLGSRRGETGDLWSRISLGGLCEFGDPIPKTMKWLQSIIIICNFSPLFTVSGEKKSAKHSGLRSFIEVWKKDGKVVVLLFRRGKTKHQRTLTSSFSCLWDISRLAKNHFAKKPLAEMGGLPPPTP